MTDKTMIDILAKSIDELEVSRLRAIGESKNIELIDKNDLIKRMGIGAPMNWTDSERELGEESQFKSDMLTIQCCQKVPAIPIPANATNGDIIKVIFPMVKWWITEDNEVFTDAPWGKRIYLDLDWWNVPYEDK